MVFQYANKGDLFNSLKKDPEEYTWQVKLTLLVNIANDLDKIHKAGYTHNDLHSGNITK